MGGISGEPTPAAARYCSGIEDKKIGEIQAIDYVAFCGGERPNWEIKGMLDEGNGQRISAKVSQS